MKKIIRDYLTVAMAMLAILLCGYGMGYLIGEKQGLRSSGTADPLPGVGGNWAELTMSRLDATLSLSPSQRKITRQKVSAASGELQQDLLRVRQSQTRILRQLYSDLDPDLDPSQRVELDKLRRELPAGD